MRKTQGEKRKEDVSWTGKQINRETDRIGTEGSSVTKVIKSKVKTKRGRRGQGAIEKSAERAGDRETKAFREKESGRESKEDSE